MHVRPTHLVVRTYTLKCGKHICGSKVFVKLNSVGIQGLEEDLELEVALYDGLETFVSAVLKTLSDRAMAWVETILPHLTPLLDREQRPELRQMVVVVTTDICEYAPTTSQKYVLELLPIYLDGCGSDHPGLKQCCAFGVGILAQKHVQVGSTLHFCQHTGVHCRC